MQFLQSILQKPLFKITSLNGLSVVLKIGIGLITSKVIAIFVGPIGMALVGNLRNFMASTETIATLGFQNGIVKYVAENSKQETALKQILSTVFIALALVALLLSGVVFFLADFWNSIIFGNNYAFSFVFKALAIALPWYASSILLICIINGLGKFKQVVYITILGNIIGLIVSVVLILQLKTAGALLSIIVSPSLVFFVALYFINLEIKLLKYLSFEWFSFGVIKNLASYSLMALVSSVVVPLVFLMIRNHVIATVGVNQAGYWEAMTRISTYYLMFINTILVVYFLPKLVLANGHQETKKIIWSYYKSTVPIFILGLIALFFIKDFVIHLLFTKAFMPVKELFLWQLLGDVLKAFSMILGYILIAKRKTTVFIITEIFSITLQFFLSQFLVSIYQIEGVVMAHFFTYVVYLLVLVIYFRKSLF